MPAKPVHLMIGKRFGKQVVVRRAITRPDNYRVAWVCRCDCGQHRAVDGYDLRSGHSTQCKRCSARARPGVGLTMLRLMHNARARAKKLGLPCTITYQDIIIPERCPLLGISLQVGRVCGPNSPSLDRLLPELGYVPGNILVISHKANTMKSDATIEELTMLTNNLQKLMGGRRKNEVPQYVHACRPSNRRQGRRRLESGVGRIYNR